MTQLIPTRACTASAVVCTMRNGTIMTVIRSYPPSTTRSRYLCDRCCCSATVAMGTFLSTAQMKWSRLTSFLQLRLNVLSLNVKRCFTSSVKSQCWFLPVCGWYKVNQAPWDKLITLLFATVLQDRSSVLWMNLTPSAQTPDHVCTVPQPACITTSAPVSTSRTAAASHASISKAIRLSSLSTRNVAIMRYVRGNVCIFQQLLWSQIGEFRCMHHEIRTPFFSRTVFFLD